MLYAIVWPIASSTSLSTTQNCRIRFEARLAIAESADISCCSVTSRLTSWDQCDASFWAAGRGPCMINSRALETLVCTLALRNKLFSLAVSVDLRTGGSLTCFSFFPWLSTNVCTTAPHARVRMSRTVMAVQFFLRSCYCCNVSMFVWEILDIFTLYTNKGMFWAFMQLDVVHHGTFGSERKRTFTRNILCLCL